MTSNISSGATMTLSIPVLDYMLGLMENAEPSYIRFEGEYISFACSQDQLEVSRCEKIKKYLAPDRK